MYQTEIFGERQLAGPLPGDGLGHDDGRDRRRRGNQRDDQQPHPQAVTERLHVGFAASAINSASKSADTLSKQVGQMPCENRASECSVM